MDIEKGQREANVADESKLTRVIMRMRTEENCRRTFRRSDRAIKWHVNFNLDKYKAMHTEKKQLHLHL